MARFADLTAQDTCSLRLRCVEAYLNVCSKVDVTQDLALTKGEILYNHCIKTLDTEKKKTP